MKSVIVVFTAEPDLSHISKAYGDIGSTNLQSPKRLVVEGDWGWFAIAVDDELEGEFSEAERARIELRVSNPVYAQLEYSNSSSADWAVKKMPAATETLIDNDHGALRTIGEVRDLIRAGVEWQTNSA